ncbi:MAG: methyltransferase domain-containing protein [Defluviitaleaceae bacterium]|nr:methyltransferase domain-containing protein [Defluviitaleaceae bacterium]
MAQENKNLLGQFIPIQYHHHMLQDIARMQGFRGAIDLLVRPSDKVLELGGGTGVLSFFAAQTAEKVYCVEYNPELVSEARRLHKLNPNCEKIEVIHGDATEYVPPEPVDVVVCEMLHSALLREKQLEVIDAFKKNYQAQYGENLPIFIPGATLQAIQPIYQDFKFEGYYAPVIMFQDPYSQQPRTMEMGDPVVYHQIVYDQPYELSVKWSGTLTASAEGKVNALRFITKNVLAVNPQTQQIVDWHNGYLVLPLEREISVSPGKEITVSFEYESGAPLTDLRPYVGEKIS